MVRYAVGYQSRAFVTFGTPIPLDGFDPESRRDVHGARAPDPRRDRTALQGAADRGGRRGDAAVDHAARARSARRRHHRRRCAQAGANLGVTTGREAVEDGAPSRSPPATSSIVERGGRFRVRERTVLRYYARTHPAPARGPEAARPHALMLGHVSKAFFHALAGSQRLKRLASRYGMRSARQLRPPVHRRRDRRGSDRRRAHDRSQRPRRSRSTTSARASPRSPRPTPRRAPTSRVIDADRRGRHRAQHLAQAHPARADGRSRDLRRQPAADPRRRRRARLLRPHRHGELAPTPRSRSTSSRRCGSRATATPASCCSRTCSAARRTRRG